jgi:hypothetical protein
MRLRYLSLSGLAACLLAGGAAAAPGVTGEYVEARSANVFVGACHHEGEIQTAGRNALLAWNFTGGAHKGITLDAVQVVAVVSGDKNLGLPDVKRRSVLYVSQGATGSQKKAAVGLLFEKAAGALGEVLEVREAPIQFDSSGDQYRVKVDGVASMQIRKATAELCCKQPYELFGKPFAPVSDAKAGYSLGVQFRDGTLLQSWSSTDQNNAFFGKFAL